MEVARMQDTIWSWWECKLREGVFMNYLRDNVNRKSEMLKRKNTNKDLNILWVV